MQLTQATIELSDIAAAHAAERAIFLRGVPLSADRAFATWVAGAAAARFLTSNLDGVEATWEADAHPWPPLLAVRRAGDVGVGEAGVVRRLLVLAEQSSMQPADEWPVRAMVDEVRADGVDGVLACYVPKRRNVDRPGLVVKPTITIVGWLSAGEVASLQVVHAEPHAGHPFPADYHEGRCAQMRPLADLAAPEG